jgi:LacI family transcriptional regulator
MDTVASEAPPKKHLREIVLDNSRNMPLHAQLRTSLERLIQEHFDDQTRFYSESQLIQELGISQGTVRRALTDLANQGLLEKRPARGTLVRKGGRNTDLYQLAVFLPDFSSAQVAQFLTLLNAECMNRNMALLPIYTHKGERLLKAYSNLKFGPKEGGVVLLENSPRATLELTAALEDKGYETVVIGTLIRDSSYKFVGGCNQTLVELGLNHLVSLGHRKITLLVNEPEEKENVQERMAAFQSYARLSSVPLEARIVSCGTKLWEDACEMVEPVMEGLMKGPDRPTAIFAVSDVGALAAIRWLQRHNVRVPEDVSVMGSDGIEVGAMIHPSLTTLMHPYREMTEAVFELLLQKDTKVRKMFLRPTLIARESTAAPANG